MNDRINVRKNDIMNDIMNDRMNEQYDGTKTLHCGHRQPDSNV